MTRRSVRRSGSVTGEACHSRRRVARISSRSLSLAEARRRVDQVESPSYDVHLDLTDPATYVARYAELGPELATRSSAFADVVGWGFPRLALDAGTSGV